MKKAKYIDERRTVVNRSSESFNKVTITPEAVFDYEHCLFVGKYPSWDECLAIAGGDQREAFRYAKRFDKPTAKLDQRAMMAEVDEYIDRQNRAGHLLCESHIRHKYLDEKSGRMLMLFLCRDKLIDMMQNWILIGICFAEDVDDDADDEIKTWLNRKIAVESEKMDWAVSSRAIGLIKSTDRMPYKKVMQEVRNEFECKRDKADAEKILLLYKHCFKRKRGHGNNGQDANT